MPQNLAEMAFRFGNQPSLGTKVAALQGQRTQNALGQHALATSQADQARAGQVREAMPGAMQGDPNALQSIAGADPDFYMQLTEKMAAMDEATRKQVAEEAEQLGRWVMMNRDNPEALAQRNITPEQVPMIESRAGMVSKAFFDVLQKEKEFSNVQADPATGQFLGMQGGQMREIPGAQRTPQQQGGRDRQFRENVTRYIGADGTHYLERDTGRGLEFINEDTGASVSGIPKDAVPQHVRDSGLTGVYNRENRVYDRATKSAAPIQDISRVLDQMDATLNTGGPVATADIRRLLSGIAPSSVRAMADLNLSSNPGGLWDRFTGNVSKFLTGEFTDIQRNQLIRDYVRGIREEMVYPSLYEIQQRAQYEAQNDPAINPARAVPRFGLPEDFAPRVPGGRQTPQQQAPGAPSVEDLVNMYAPQ